MISNVKTLRIKNLSKIALISGIFFSNCGGQIENDPKKEEITRTRPISAIPNSRRGEAGFENYSGNGGNLADSKQESSEGGKK